MRRTLKLFVIPAGKPLAVRPSPGLTSSSRPRATTRSSPPRTSDREARAAGARGVVHAHRPRRVRGGRAVTTPDAIHAADERLQTILKAHVVGATVQDPASRPAGEDTASAFTSAGALIPPYDPETLCLLVEHSNSLRQNVDAYATNIDGNGYRFDAVIDFDAEDARSKVADAITLERLAAREARTLPEGMSTTPSAEEVSARFTELRQAARVERARLDAFFDFACFDHSFVDLRRRTRQDLEVTGNAFWEVLRDGKGDLARLVYVPSYTVRLLPLDREAVEVPSEHASRP
jgi:hypothetical protein